MSKIAVYFPGIGYHCDKPLLYYSRRIAEKLGYGDSRTVSYSYSARNIRGNDEKMKEAFEILFTQTEVALADIVWTEYDGVLFISKSIGTVIATSYAKKNGLIYARYILYTPLAQTFLFAPGNAVGFIGTADPWNSIDEITRLSAENHIPLTVYEGGNHSLESDDILENIDTLKDVMQRTRDFIGG